MAVPAQDSAAGWYKLGHQPSEIGNTVINGHVSLTSGRQGIFHDLAKLAANDAITVTDHQQRQYHFVVTGSATYGRDDFPLQDVFDGQQSQTLLKLITCENYDRTQKTYAKRRVVTARLVSE